MNNWRAINLYLTGAKTKRQAAQIVAFLQRFPKEA